MMNPCRILIVEDEAIVAMDIEDRLLSMGYHLVGRASRGEEAVDLVREKCPDLVLMDIRLQGEMDGIEAAEEIRRRLSVPVIFLTANSEDATVERAKRAGPYGYILKPYDHRELKSAIEIGIHRHAADKEIARLNHLLDVLSQVNQSIVYIQSKDDLLPQICRLVVERGGFDLAWIHWLDPRISKVSTVCHSGQSAVSVCEEDFSSIQLLEGRGDPFDALRRGDAYVCNGCEGQDCLYCSLPNFSGLGFRSCGSFPITFRGDVCGMLNLCASESGYFREREIELLKEVAADVSFALDKIEGDAERRQAEARVVRQNAVLAGINRIFQEALGGRSDEGLGQVCLEVAEQVTGSQIGFIGEVGPDGLLHDVAISDPGWDQCSMVDQAGQRRPPGKFKIHGLYGRVLLDGKSLLTNEPSQHPDSIGTPSGHPPLTAFLGVPLIRKGRTIGMIGVGNREGGYTEEDREALTTLATAVTESFARKRAEQRLRESEERQRIFIEHAPASLAMFDREMRYLAASRRWLTDYNLVDRELKGLSLYEVFPDVPEYWKAAHRRGLAGEVVWKDNDRFDRADGLVQWLRWEVRPWHTEDGGIGGIVIFTEDITQRKLAEEAVVESEGRFKLLSRTASELLASEDPQGIIEGLCHEVMEHLDCQAFFNFLVHEDANKLRLNACAGIPAEEARRIEWLDYGAAVCGCVARDKQRVVACDIRNTPDPRTDLIKSYGIRAYACHPLMVQGELIGTLSFGTRTRDRFSDQDLALMKTVADQVAVAMQRIRLIEDLQRSQSELETRVEERTVELRAMNEALRHSNQDLEDFAHVASHDLQEPLRKIQTFSDRLLTMHAGALDEKATGYLERMHRAGARMQALLQDLLRYSRVTSKAEPFERVELMTVVEEAVMDLTVLCEETGGRVEFHDLPVIEGDRVQIRQLFQNLIGNGLKYHGTPKPLVKVLCSPAPDGPFWEFHVKDNGIGFDVNYLDRIFKPFQRLHGHSAPYQGTGMGLAICRRIVERHGGMITATSQIGNGATFIVKLPKSPLARSLPPGH